jgi:hypothetical protein
MEEKKKEENDNKPRFGTVRFEKEVSHGKETEKRMHPRFLLNLPIEYSRFNSPVRHSSHTINASEGGLMICLHEKIDAGQYLHLKIFYSSGSNLLTIETRVRVMWADATLGEDGNYRHGVKFADITSEDLGNFKGFLNSLSPLLIT